jgi:hypothetical protein
MPSKKYHTYYSEKEKVYDIQEIKKNIIVLERDVTKIHQNLKNISRKIYYLYDAMTESSESSSSESEVEKIVASECSSSEEMKVKCYKPKKKRYDFRPLKFYSES